MWSQEAHEGRISLNDDDPEAVGRMVRYLYTMDYDEGDNSYRVPSSYNTQNPNPTMSVSDEPGDYQLTVSMPPITARAAAIFHNIMVYALAEKYDVQDLKDLAKEKFRSRSASHLWLYDDLFSALELIYSITPSSDQGLRAIISKLCADKIDGSEGEILANPRFREIISKDGSMAFDVLVQSQKKHESMVNDLKHQVREQGTKVQDGLERIRHMEIIANEDQKTMKDFITEAAICPHCKKSSHLTFETSEQTNDGRSYIYCMSAFCGRRCLMAS